MQDKDLLQLSDEQQLILQEMKTLLPYNDEIQPTPSGMLPLKMKHFFDKQCMLTQQDLFDEFEMRTEKKNAGCFFRDYFEACCISLISQCRPTHPIRRCSLCGRYHIATQNRMGDTIYCYRMSFQNPNKKCSEYNSHFVKKNTGSDRRKELNKKIENIRPYFSKITKVEDVLMFNDCVRYLRAWLVIAKAEAKRLDLCGQSIDHVEVVVNKIDQLRFQLSKNEVQERLIEIGKRIGYYPTIGELASALHQSQG